MQRQYDAQVDSLHDMGAELPPTWVRSGDVGVYSDHIPGGIGRA